MKQLLAALTPAGANFLLSQMAALYPQAAAAEAAKLVLPPPRPPVPPPINPTFRARVLGLLRSNPATALRAAVAVPDGTPRLNVLTTIAQVAAGRGQMDIARQAADAATTSSCLASSEGNTKCTSNDARLAVALRRVGEADEAEQLNERVLGSAVTTANEQEAKWAGLTPAEQYIEAMLFIDQYGSKLAVMFEVAADVDFAMAARYAQGMPDGIDRPLALVAAAREFQVP